MKTTQGPWRVGDAGWTIFGPPRLGKTPEVVATCTTRADAALIRATPELLLALEGLAREINLSKLKIRKDFSLINAHAYATKVLHAIKEVEA